MPPLPTMLGYRFKKVIGGLLFGLGVMEPKAVIHRKLRGQRESFFTHRESEGYKDDAPRNVEWKRLPPQRLSFRLRNGHSKLDEVRRS